MFRLQQPSMVAIMAAVVPPVAVYTCESFHGHLLSKKGDKGSFYSRVGPRTPPRYSYRNSWIDKNCKTRCAVRFAQNCGYPCRKRCRQDFKGPIFCEL